jgi:hypothetical protein
MPRFLFILMVSLITVPAWGQMPQATRRAQMYDQMRDSLRRAFEQEPPFIRVAYSHNWQRGLESMPVALFVTHRGRPVSVRAIAGQGFLLPPGVGDSLALGVEVNGHVQWFDPVPTRYFTYGAAVTFGYVNRAHLRKPTRTDEDGWEMDEEVRLVREPLERQHWRRAKGLLGVRYQIISPRVYGDGMVHTTNVPVFRK